MFIFCEGLLIFKVITFNNKMTSNMGEQLLPIVPFGKYKGQPITTLMNDTKYLEWCKQQEWFQKYTIVYNICVNQTITTSNQNSKTPEHNKLQNMFLDNKLLEKIIKITNKNFIYKKNIDYYNVRAEFEGLFNWDVIIPDICYNKSKCKCNWKLKEEDSVCDCGEGYEDNDDEYYNCRNIYIEIKPCLGDDYPSVLRKMKSQIELTNISLKKKRQNELDELGYKEGYVGGQNWAEIKYIHKNYDAYQGKFILLIKDFNSNNTTKEQLIEIFNQTFIKVVFINELFDNLPSQIIKNKTEQITIHSTSQQEIEEENKLLREKNLQAEEKIRQLEEEIQSLKIKNKSKSIKDFFGKK
jgi:uncharacterized protein (DUF3820 family)